MKSCENHDKCIVVFQEGDCPLCTAEKTFKCVWEEMEKSMTILKELKQAGEEAGLKIR
jgi:protein-disulfide isomerase